MSAHAHFNPRRLSMLCLGALFTLPAFAAPPLPALNIDIGQTSVSGISSGGFMSVQFQMAHSSIVKGAGVVAGGPFNCSKADVMRAVAKCSCTGEPSVPCAVTETSADVPSLVAGAEAMAGKGLIDPVRNVAGQRVLTISGAKDTLVPPPIAHQLTAFYSGLDMPSTNLATVSLPNAGHTMPTQKYGIACSVEKEPYIGKCAYDSAGQILSWIYGPLKAAGAKPAGKFIQFDQSAYIPPDQAGWFSMSTGLDSTAWAYVPNSCAKGEKCRVHIALHGCKQGQSYLPLTPPPGGGLYNGTLFVKHTGYDQWADNNHIVILYPQAVSIPFRNPNGCWDWWGYTGPDYATKNAVQIRTLRAMVDGLAGGTK
ncbi:MAG TPA: poly(3-hydroxybutyrate) depolymerase [Zoogloea sp.]|uniref:extracellular catalytic domain type 2 short-chain-length polyhydroxyalkanoate depolymerase n=1 Tax=Zoogloea sp. TaxID=49181 RepID=UPI002CD2AD84|nr:poly(3-hydroxybutyrate) depolymerase [Zoogloea sp.]HOB46818.1 poly(3-hydroxybutyrate) depolymerase [Zoogloea sp.]HQA11236.1 poly(3-hydroxybutyrate) depolymerase [Zoogloea sp.]HQE40239.1 poly(3-hydroxybutyrate) depolymerase [Zoogloea sp.]